MSPWFGPAARFGAFCRAVPLRGGFGVVLVLVAS
jgi:hypothetical protein